MSHLDIQWSQGAWPEPSARYLLDLLQNAQSNAEIKGLEVDNLYIQHIQVTEAPKVRRRTYRAHGRINPYMACPCHIELILSANPEVTNKPEGQKKVKKVRACLEWGFGCCVLCGDWIR